jgi:hypothetical protein
MLLAVGAVYGQQAVTISPPNPVAHQPITIYVTEPTTATNYVYITFANKSQNCQNFTSSSSASGYEFGPITSNSEGEFYVTLTKGLPAGAYCVIVVARVQGISGAYHTHPELFTVGASEPVPEFNGTLIVFSLSFAAVYCILERRRIRRRK